LNNENLRLDNILVGYPDVLGIEDLMQILKIGKNLAYRLVQEKTIPAKKVGRDWIIAKSQLIKYILEVQE